jgi:hypothetical protein
MWTYRYAGLRLHSEIPLVALLGLVHFRIPLLLLIFGGLGAAIKVASMIVPCFMAMPLALRWAFTASKICWPRSCFSTLDDQPDLRRGRGQG